MARAGLARQSHDTRAVLLRRISYGESDLVVSLFTEALGRVSALARGARKSTKRFGGSLEPFHTLRVRVEERPSADLSMLVEASLEVPRARLTESLERMDAAGHALGWVRRTSPPSTPEPAVWRELASLLDDLEAGASPPRRALAEHGLRLLGAYGWGLDLAQCVRCGKPCTPGRAAMLDIERGGLVCRACGGAPLTLSGAARARIADAQSGVSPLANDDVDLALDVIERAFSAHAER